MLNVRSEEESGSSSLVWIKVTFGGSSSVAWIKVTIGGSSLWLLKELDDEVFIEGKARLFMVIMLTSLVYDAKTKRRKKMN